MAGRDWILATRHDIRSAVNAEILSGPDAACRTARRDAVTASLVALSVGAVLAWQTFGMPSSVRQFTKYPRAAVSLPGGSQTSERLIDYSPLYLEVHRVAQAWLPDPFTGVLAFQVGCVALALALFFMALRRHVSLPIALVATVALGFERSVTVHTYIFEPEALLLLLLVGWLFFAQRPGLANAAAAGTTLAFAQLTRPALLPIAVVMLWHFFGREETRRRAVLAATFSFLPVAIALGLLAVRNHQAAGSWSPAVMNPGTVFFDGNNPQSIGAVVEYPPVVKDLADSHPAQPDYAHEAYRRLARLDQGRQLTVGEVNRFWMGKACRFLRDEPGVALLNVARKVFFTLHSYRWYDIRSSYHVDRALKERGVPATPLALVSALALAGLGYGLGNWRILFPGYALFLSQMMVMVLTYASARQRLALLPALVLFAALALQQLAASGRRRVLVGAGVLLFATLLWRDTDVMRDSSHTFEPVNAPAHSLTGAGGDLRRDRASLLDQALEAYEAGRYEEAELLLTDLWRERYVSVRGQPVYYLGRIAARRGRPEEAAAFMREALARAPGNFRILAQLAVLTGERSYAELLFRYYDRMDARFALGLAFLNNNMPEQAVAELSPVAAELPDARYVAVELEKALAGSRAVPAGSAGRP